MEEEAAAPTWNVAVVVAKVDIGGSFVDATPEQLGVCGPGFQPVTVAELVPEPPEDGEGNVLPVTPNVVAAALAARISADKEAGVALKVEAAAEAEAAAAGAENVDAESSVGPSVKLAPSQSPAVDATYVLLGLTDTLDDADGLLRSDMPLDAVITLRLPGALMPPQPEAGEEDEPALPPPAVENLIAHMANYVAESLPPASSRNEISWASLVIGQPPPPETGKLDVTVERCLANIPRTDAEGEHDPYCKLSLGEVTGRTDQRAEDSAAPEWNQAIELQIDIAQLAVAAPLKIQIYDADPNPGGEDDDLIAEAQIDVREFVPAWNDAAAIEGATELEQSEDGKLAHLITVGSTIAGRMHPAGEVLPVVLTLEYGTGNPPSEEEAAGVSLAEMSRDLQNQMQGVLYSALLNREAYAQYRDSVKVVPIEEAVLVPVSQLTLYRSLIDSLEGETSAQEGQVLYCLIEQLVASLVQAGDEKALSNEFCALDNVLDGTVVREQTVSAALQAAMTEFGADEVGQQVGRQSWLPGSSANVEASRDLLGAMAAKLPLPGKDRNLMPQEPLKSDGDRLAESASLYHFVDLRPEQVGRALLRDEFGHMIVGLEEKRYERPKTPAGRLRAAAALQQRWDSHLASRTYFESLGPAAMTAAYTRALTTTGPAAKVHTMYCDREDTLLVVLHTPTPPISCVSEPTVDSCGVPCLPTRAHFDDGYRPDLVYGVAPSQSKAKATQQCMFPSDSGVVMARKNESTGLEHKAWVSGHVMSSKDGILTVTLDDGNVVVAEPQRVTVTDPCGRTTTVETAGIVVTDRGSTTPAAKARALTTLDPVEKKVAVVGSKGTCLKIYEGGSQHVMFANGDTSAYDADRNFWVDANIKGARLGREEGKKNFFVRPLNCVSNMDYVTGTEHVVRDDLVAVARYTDGSVVTEHPGGVRMKATDKCVTVVLEDYALHVTCAEDVTTASLPGGSSVVLSQGSIAVSLPGGNSLSLKDAIAEFRPAFPGNGVYSFDLVSRLSTVQDPAGNVFTVDSEGLCDAKLVHPPDATSSLRSTAVETVIAEPELEPELEPEVEPEFSADDMDGEIRPDMLLSVATNESAAFMDDEEIDGEETIIRETEEAEDEEQDDDSDEENANETASGEFSAVKCPAQMPDLDEHETIMAHVLRSDPSIYTLHCNDITALGVPFARCIKTGMDHCGPPGIVGIVAGDEECYTKFAGMFDPVIDRRHRGYKPGQYHVTDLNPEAIQFPALDPDGKYIISTRIRTGRSIRGLRLAPSITEAERRKVEEIMTNALLSLDGHLAGDYFPLAGSESYAPKIGGMSAEEEDQLREDRFLFQETDNPVTISGGIGRDWPDARGVFVNDAKNFLVWVNEEDHTRIISMELGSDIASVFKRYCESISQVQSNLRKAGYEFQHSDHLGYILTCPSQLGTGMRASVMIKLPLLSQRGDFRAVCANMKLDVRGGIEDVYDLSNHDRLGRSEVQLIKCLIDGIKKVIEIEMALEAGEDVEEIISEIAAIAEAGEVYGDESGPPPPPVPVQSHAPRCFVVRPDGSGFEWAIQAEAEAALADGAVSQELVPSEPDSVVYTIASTAAPERTVTMHASLTEEEQAKMADGLARFESWSMGKGGETELPEAKPVPQPMPEPEPQPEVVWEPEPEQEPEPEPEPPTGETESKPQAPRLPSEVKALNNGLPPSCYWDSRECEHVMGVEAKRAEEQGATKDAPSPEPTVAEPLEVAATKDGDVSSADAHAPHDTSQEYYLGKGSAMQGTGLKTNLLLTADTIPPDIYGQPRRVVPTVPALRPDYVSSTVPNVAYAVVEGPARRRLKGLSSNFLNLTPAPSQQAPSQVLIQPGLLDFGVIETGGTYRLPISLTNISVEISRFRVRQPRHALLKVLFTPGPVMAGMTTKMEVELTASVACVIEEVVEITTEAQVFSLPLVAQIGDGGHDGELVPSPSRRISSKAAHLRAEVTQASAAMAQPEFEEQAAGLLAGHPDIQIPEVPAEVEYVPQDLDAISLEQLKNS